MGNSFNNAKNNNEDYYFFKEQKTKKNLAKPNFFETTPTSYNGQKFEEIKKEDNYVPPIVMPNIQTIKSYTEIESLLGKPIATYTNTDAFFSRSYNEDMFLCAGNRQKFGKRFEWKNGNNYIVCYVDNNNNFMKAF